MTQCIRDIGRDARFRFDDCVPQKPHADAQWPTTAAWGLPNQISVPDEPRGAAELEELYQSVRHGKPIVHDGRWGEATLEVCLAIHESARTRAEVRLTRQTAVPAQ